MKNYFILTGLVLMFLALSCKNDKNADQKTDTREENQENLIVQGKLNGGNDQMVYLEKLSPTKVVPKDSAMIGEGGEYQLQTEIKRAGLYRLKTTNNDFAFLLPEPGEEISLNATYGNITRSYEIKGSPSSELAHDMNVRLVGAADSLQKIQNAFEGLRDETGSKNQEKIAALRAEAQDLIKEQNQYLRGFIKENKESLVVYLALFQQVGREMLINIEEDRDIFNYVLKQMQAHYPGSPFTSSLKSELNKYDIQKKQQSQSQGNAGKYGAGDLAPDISLPDPQGNVHSLGDQKGKYVLLDFWAGWCRPCRMENPNLVDIYNRFKDENFTIFQVSLDKTKKSWTNAIEKDNLGAWIHVSDLKYWQSDAAALYEVRSIPANYLLNPEGEIIATNLRGPALGKKLEEIFGK